MFKFEKDKSCLLPIDLFEIEVDIPFAQNRPVSFSKYRLPKFPELFYSSSFAEVGLYYNNNGIGGRLEVDLAFAASEYPDYQKGDCLELLIATKNMTHAASVSRFCHHFVIFPVEIGGFYGKEITHFSHDDARAVFDPVSIDVKADFDKKRYSLDFFIGKESLYGFDDIGDFISFTYVVHAQKQEMQNFSCSYSNFNMAQMPSLWASGKLINKEKSL